MKKIRSTLLAALALATVVTAAETPAAGSIGVGYYGTINTTNAIGVQYKIDDKMGIAAGIGLNLLDGGTDIDFAAQFIYVLGSAGSVQAQVAPGIQLGLPDDDNGPSLVSILLPLRAEWFVSSNFSIHTQAGLTFDIYGEFPDGADNGIKSLRTFGDVVGAAGFTLYL